MSSKPARESQGRAAENSGLTPTPCRPPPRARHSCHFHLQHALHALTYSVREIMRPPSNGYGVDK